jgi:hypothetical protein
MANLINADPTNGLKLISDGSSEIQIQSNGVTVCTINADGLSMNTGTLAGDGSQLTNLPVVGVGQTWTDVEGSRVKDVTYTNTTGKTIALSVVYFNSTSINTTFSVDGNVIARVRDDTATNHRYTYSIIVPNLSTYITTGSGTIDDWWELR